MSHVQSDPTPDLHPDTLGAIAALMLAQGQDCFCQKAMQGDHDNDNIIKNYFVKFLIIFFPFTAKLFNFNFHPLEVVSRCCNPHLQVAENYSDFTKWRSTIFKSC